MIIITKYNREKFIQAIIEASIIKKQPLTTLDEKSLRDNINRLSIKEFEEYCELTLKHTKLTRIIYHYMLLELK